MNMEICMDGRLLGFLGVNVLNSYLTREGNVVMISVDSTTVDDAISLSV